MDLMTADRKFVTASYDADISPALKAFMREGWAPDPIPPTEPAEVAPYAAKRRDALSAAFTGRPIVVPTGLPRVRNDDTFYVRWNGGGGVGGSLSGAA